MLAPVWQTIGLGFLLGTDGATISTSSPRMSPKGSSNTSSSSSSSTLCGPPRPFENGRRLVGTRFSSFSLVAPGLRTLFRRSWISSFDKAENGFFRGEELFLLEDDDDDDEEEEEEDEEEDEENLLGRSWSNDWDWEPRFLRIGRYSQLGQVVICFI